MDTNPFNLFIDLVKFDQHCVCRKKQKKSLEKDIAHHMQEKEACRKKLDLLNDTIHTLKKDIAAGDLDVSCLIDQEKSIEKKRDAAQSVKSFDALQKEMNSAVEKRKNAEDVLLEKWLALEEQQERYNAALVDCNKQAQEYDKSIAEKQVVCDQISEELKVLEQKRHDYLKDSIPREWLDKYNTMKARVDNPVVPVENSVCTGCYNVVSAHDLQELQRHCILPCKSCYRLLYIV